MSLDKLSERADESLAFVCREHGEELLVILVGDRNGSGKSGSLPIDFDCAYRLG